MKYIGDVDDSNVEWWECDKPDHKHFAGIYYAVMQRHYQVWLAYSIGGAKVKGTSTQTCLTLQQAREVAERLCI